MVNVLTEVISVVESTLRMPAGKLDIDAGFESFGMDSIIMMEMITNLSKRLDISITPAQLTDVNTVKELADSIQNDLESHNLPPAVVKTEPEHAPSIIKNSPSAIVSSAKVNPVTRTLRGSNRTLRKSNTQTKFDSLLRHINQQFAIDLTGHRFQSLDEIVDVLVTNHFEELITHYDHAESVDIVQSIRDTFSNQAQQEPSQQSQDIAIIGLSCNFPDAPDTRTFWQNLLDQKNSISEIPSSRWNWQDHYSDSPNSDKTSSKWGALIEDVDCFDPEFFNLSSDEAAIMDPQERLLLQETYRAFQDAGIDTAKISGSKTGVFVGYEYCEYEQYLRKSAVQMKDGPVFSSSSHSYYLANRLSYVFNFCGPSESINTNCASSAVAINRAFYSLINRESNLAMAAGVCLNLFADDYIAGSQYGMLSPDGTCGVFDDKANGFTRGEGIGTIILKRLDDAKKDNNKIYAVIKSCHQNNRGNANDISEIKHQAITEVLKGCYENASITPENINYIEVDGYATKWGDSFEFEGIKNVYKNIKPDGKHCALGSLKGNIGHLEPASGMASVIKVALSLAHKQFPATITNNSVSEFIDIKNKSHPLYIANKAIAFDSIRKDKDTPIRAGVNSFADSGVNVHLLLEEYINADVVPKTMPKVKGEAGTSQLFILSAKNHQRLSDYVQKYIDFLSVKTTDISFTDMVYSVQTGREMMDEKLAIIAASSNELLEKLKLVSGTNLQTQPDLQDHGIFYGNLAHAKMNPLMSLITQDMGSKQIESSLLSQEWQKLALLWVNGVELPWENIWQNINTQRISLPGYPFAKDRYWFEASVDESVDTVKKSTSQKSKTKTDIVDLTTENLASNSTQSTKPYQAARTETEKKLVSIWSKAMEVAPETIGIYDSFFEMGGDSILATQLVSKIRSELAIDLPLIAFLDVDTLASAAEVIDAIKYQDDQMMENDDVYDFEEGSI